MQDDRKRDDTDPRMSDAGTVAGRAPAPVAPKPDADDAPTGSPGAATDREQAKERQQAKRGGRGSKK